MIYKNFSSGLVLLCTHLFIILLVVVRGNCDVENVSVLCVCALMLIVLSFVYIKVVWHWMTLDLTGGT